MTRPGAPGTAADHFRVVDPPPVPRPRPPADPGARVCTGPCCNGRRT